MAISAVLPARSARKPVAHTADGRSATEKWSLGPGSVGKSATGAGRAVPSTGSWPSQDGVFLGFKATGEDLSPRERNRPGTPFGPGRCLCCRDLLFCEGGNPCLPSPRRQLVVQCAVIHPGADDLDFGRRQLGRPPGHVTTDDELHQGAGGSVARDHNGAVVRSGHDPRVAE